MFASNQAAHAPHTTGAAHACWRTFWHAKIRELCAIVRVLRDTTVDAQSPADGRTALYGVAASSQNRALQLVADGATDLELTVRGMCRQTRVRPRSLSGQVWIQRESVQTYQADTIGPASTRHTGVVSYAATCQEYNPVIVAEHVQPCQDTDQL